MAIYQGDEKIVDCYVGETLVTRAYQGDKLIFDAYSELSDTLPLTVRSRASQVLENYTVYGESVQDGTPTPDNPVEVTGLGVRTANLFNKGNPPLYPYGYYLNSQGVATKSSSNPHWYITDYIKVNELTAYYLIDITDGRSFGSYTCFYDSNKNFIGSQETRYNRNKNVTTPQGCAYMCVSRTAPLQTMIIMGDEIPDDYIPYGYELPITVTSNGTTTDYPIYIGDSQLMRIPDTEYADYVDYEKGKIVRRVKKLVLTGEESIQRYAKNVFFISMFTTQAPTSNDTFCLSNEYKYATGGLYGLLTTDMSVQVALTEGSYPIYVCIHDSRFDASENFKSHFADQYAAGTPVTFWYSLKTPVEEDPPVSFPDIILPRGKVTIDVEGNLKPQAIVKGRINPTA